MFIYRQRFTRLDNLPINLPVELDRDRIVFQVLVENAKRTWNRSGTLTRNVLIPGIGFTEDEPKVMAIGKKLIDYEPLGNYRLKFSPYIWILNYEISIWKLPSN